MLKFTLFLISVIFLNCIVAAPLSKLTGCKQGCPSTSKGSKLKYLPGQSYSYNFDSTVSISLTGNDPQDIQLKVTGTAHVNGISTCQYGLDLHDVTVIGPDNLKTKFNNKVDLSKSVQFTLSNDELDDEVCTSPDEPEVSLNIKRALISLLQVNDENSEEVDVFGKCKTNYVVNKNDDGSFVITKTRDLNACSHRESFVNGFITGVFNENSNVKSTPLLSGDYTNEIRINKNGIVESAQVVEDYTLVPFSNGEAGVRARVVTQFRLKDQKVSVEKVSVSVPRSLIYENAENPQAVNYKTAKKSLFDICEQFVERGRSVGPTIAGQFTESIRLLRYMKKDDILLLFKESNQVKGNPVCRKVFLDAIFRVGTADSVNAIVSLLTNHKIHEKRLAFLSFNLATSVNKETITLLTKLIGIDNFKEAYLNIGNLIKKYTQQEGTQNDPELLELFSELAKKLGTCSGKTRYQEDVIVAILKGLRGAEGVTGPLLEKLVQCSKEGHSGRVRVAAIQAFRSASGNQLIQQAALNILKNRKDDSEFRIESYLALVESSTPQIANEVSKLLEDEPVYQVGSFITSHLSNLRASTDLYREKARKDFADVYSSKKFPKDIRKFSFNHEFSYEFGSLGLGGSTDSNIIFSQNSFTPRSIRTNITGELFGTSFNIFELNGRQENFDLILERYFGPKGYFNTLNKQEALEKIHDFVTGGTMRPKRDLAKDGDNFGKEYVGRDNRDVDFDLSLKMFGSELYFLSLGDNIPAEQKDFTKEFSKILQSFLKNSKEGKKHQHDWHSLFLDAEFAYPTSSGFPLKIQAQGSGAFHLESTLKADFKEIHSNPQNTKFAVSIVPSYNVEFTGILSVDGYEVTTGVKVTSNVHSATGSQISFELSNQGKGVDLKVDFPFKKQEILSFDHKVVFIQQNLGHESVTHNLKSSQKKDLNVRNDCFDQFNKYLGVTVCYELSTRKGEKLANSRIFPLNGPAHVSAYIEIEKQYHFNARFDDSNAQKKSLELIFDTPQSNPTRKISIKFEGAIQPKAFFSATIESPYKSAKAEIGINNDDKELTIYGQANSDAIQYLLKLGFHKAGSGQRREFSPFIEFNNPDAIPYKVSGKVISDSSKPPKTRYTFEKLTIEPVQKDGRFGPLVLDGWFEHQNVELFESALDIKYKASNGNLKFKVAADKQNFDLDVSLLSDFAEFANGRVAVVHKHSDKQVKNSFVVVYGRDLESKTNRIELTNDVEFEKEGDKYVSHSCKNVLIIPPVKIRINAGHHKNHFDYDVEFGYLKNQISSKFNADVNKKSPGDWDIKFDAAVNKHNIDISSQRDIDEATQRSTLKNEIKTSFGTNIVINSKFDNNFNAQKIDFSADGNIVLARGQKPLKANVKLLVNPKKAETNGKIVADTTELVTFNGVLNRDANQPITGTLDINVPELFVAHGDYNSNKGNGKSEFVITFPKFDRKVKVITKYEVGPAKFDLRNDFYYNFEKDNSRHIAFDTKNKHSAGSFESANELEINGEKFHFEIGGTKTGELKNGKINGRFLLRLPTQREIAGTLDRQLDLFAPKANGHINIKLTDTIAQGGRKERSAEFDGTLKDGNREQHFFDLLHKLTLTDFDGKPIIIENHIKHLPKGEYKTASVNLKVHGSVPLPVEFNVGIDEYCPIHAVYNANVKYGNAANAQLNGDYAVGEAGKKPSTFKISGEISVPQTKLNKITFDTRGSLKTPAENEENGQYDYDFKFNTHLNEKVLEVASKAKFAKKTGDFSLDVKLPDVDAFAIDWDYNYDRQVEQGSYHAAGNFVFRYGNGKSIKFSGDGKAIEGKELSYHGSITTPYEKAKSFDVKFKLQKKDENTYSNEAELSLDDNKYKLSNVVVTSHLSPSFTLDFYYPQDKHSQISVVVTRLQDRKYKLSVRLDNINNFQLNGDVELNYQNNDNFGVILDLDSAVLKANKLHVDIHTLQNGNNKGIQFSATQQNQNIISGTADYSVKQEKGKTTIEGHGNVNWYDKSSKLTFQFMRSTFTQAENHETGVSLVFNGQIGPKNIQAELKLTDKEFYVQNTICESDKPCIHLKVSSILSDVEWKRFTHNLLVTVDLRPVGFTHEFNLKADTKRDGYLFEHTFDTQIQSADQNKYQFNVYVKPKTAGIVLSIPKRTAAIEATYTYPQEFIGVYQATITSYLDKKNNPGKHSTIGFKGEIKHPSKYTFITSGSLIASHPSVKDLKISGESEFSGEKRLIAGNLKFDVFKNTNQAIIIAARYGNTEGASQGFNVTTEISLKSPGLGLNYVFYDNTGVSFARRTLTYTFELRGPSQKDRFGIYLNGDAKKIEFTLVVFDEDLLKATAEFDPKKKIGSVQSSVKLLGTEPIISQATASLNAFTANIKQGNFLSIEAEATAAKSVSLKATGNQKILLNYKVALDQEHLLQTQYEINDKEFKEFLKAARNKISEDRKRAQTELENNLGSARQSLTQQVNRVKDNLPDLSRLNADYKEGFEQFNEDLLADKSIKELVDIYKKTYEALNKTIGEILRTLTEHFTQISKTINEFFKQLYDGFNERILPSLKESYNHIDQVLTNLFDELLSSLHNLFDRLVDSLKKFEEDFKKISSSANEWSKKIAKSLGEQWTIVLHEIEDVYKLFLDHLKSFPGIEVLKEKYNELVARIPVNDAEELKKLAEKALATLKQWLLLAQEQLQTLGVDSTEDFYGLPFVWFQKNAQFLPQLATLRFSAWNYLLNEPIPSLKELLFTYRPYAFNPLHLVPPFPIEGRIVEGEYLFTFDGSQITLPGSCHYVLAKDIVDGNFTIIAKIADKKLQSIAITDKSGASIDLSASGKVQLNDKQTEFPVLEPTLYAWRTYESYNLYSNYGALVKCSLDLKACHVNINGFYFSKLRGLLGKGGYEQYDAKTLPNGKIADTTTLFANAYKLHTCPDVVIDERHKHIDDAKSPECEKVFGAGSSLRFTSYVLDSSQYVEACQHAVKNAANKQEVACNIGFGYVTHAIIHNIPARLPNICQKCEVTDDAGAVKSYQIGETFSTTTGKKADIVFVVDTAIEAKTLTDLVQHFIVDLRHALKKDYDTHISVIGYKKGDVYYNHYTSDGKLDITKFHLPSKPENNPHEEKIVSVGCKYLDPVLQKLYNVSIKVQDELSLLADGRAFREALLYPFRANAHRSIIAIRSDVLQHSSNPIKLIGAKAVNEIAKRMGINLHMLAPIPELKFNNNLRVDNIVGFSDKTLAFMPGTKAGGQDRQQLQYGLDLGADMVNESGGFAFSLTNYLAQDAQNQRKFLKVAANNIAQQFHRTESVLECVCTLHYGFQAREACHETDRTVKSRK